MAEWKQIKNAEHGSTMREETLRSYNVLGMC
jgi:hypothetical protein